MQMKTYNILDPTVWRNFWGFYRKDRRNPKRSSNLEVIHTLAHRENSLSIYSRNCSRFTQSPIVKCPSALLSVLLLQWPLPIGDSICSTFCTSSCLFREQQFQALTGRDVCLSACLSVESPFDVSIFFPSFGWAFFNLVFFLSAFTKRCRRLAV